MRRKIKNDMVPIPSDWAGFNSLEDNKTDLSLLLSNYLIDLCPTNKLIVVSGGYTESTMVISSDPSLSVNCLMADHEESSVGIGARSFNIDRSSHRTADIDTYYQHFNIETTCKKQTKIK